MKMKEFSVLTAIESHLTSPVMSRMKTKLVLHKVSAKNISE